MTDENSDPILVHPRHFYEKDCANLLCYFTCFACFFVFFQKNVGIFSNQPIFPATGLATNQKIGIIRGTVADRMPLWNRPHAFGIICMDNSLTASRQHGLTLVQWGFLFVAFMVGIGGSFVVRGVFPPAHAGVIQSAPVTSDASSR